MDFQNFLDPQQLELVQRVEALADTNQPLSLAPEETQRLMQVLFDLRNQLCAWEEGTP